MGLGGEVENGIDLLFAADGFDKGPIVDVSMDKSVAGVVWMVGVGCVGEEVEIDDAERGKGSRKSEEEVDAGGADEAGASGDEDRITGAHGDTH